MQKCNKFKNIAIVHVKKSAYRIYFLYMSKREAKKIIANSNLIDKKDVWKKKIYFLLYIKVDKTTYYQRKKSYHEMSEEKKQKLKEYQKKYREAKNNKWNSSR